MLLTILPAAGAPAQVPPRVNAEAERAQLHYRLGWESLRSEAFEAARKEFQQAIDLNAKFTLAYYGLGKAHMGLHRYANAVAAFETCRDFYVARGGEKFSGQFDANRQRQDRIMELQELARQSRQGPQTQQAQDQQRQILNAIRQTQDEVMRGINMNIDATAPAFVSLALGSAYFRAQRIPDAEREYKATIDADPKAGEAHNNLAVVYMLTGRIEAAAQEIALAEKSRFRVNPDLKADIAARLKQAK
jgi:tetratricopeptide (TPR) repeat protein